MKDVPGGLDLDIGGQLEWGKPGFGSWVHTIQWCVKGQGLGLKIKKPSGRDLVFLNGMRGAWIWMDSGGLIWAG